MNRTQNAQHKPLIPASYSLLLLSFASIFLEIALTRLFSTLFYPPYVFAIISLAVLGLGLGAALAAWRAPWRAAARLPLYLSLGGLLALALLLTAVFTASLDLHGGLLALVPLPYFWLGLGLATFFSANPADSPRLYRADLLGAGLGALAAVPLLNSLGALNAVLLAAAGLGLAALLAARRPGPAPLPMVAIGLALVGLLTNLAFNWLDVPMGQLAAPKPITNSLRAGGRIIATEWDAFARTDLVDPGGGKPYELYLDGAAGSVMPPSGDLNLLRTDIGFFPFATQQPRQVLVIGPGGGLDVWFALHGRAQQVTAVEINPASVTLVNRYATYHGDLYRQPGVRLLVDEGRSVLRREARQYDLIYLSQVVTLAAERGGYALTENTIYTVEAFQEYLAHLRPGGQIAMKLYDELTLTRAVVTAVTALAQARGLSEAEAMRHLAVFLDGDAEPPVPLLLVQADPFERDAGLALAGVAAQVGFVPLFVPDVAGGPTLQAILAGEATTADIISETTSDVTPTSDDRPFFYQFEPGLPQSLRPLLWGLGGMVLAGGALLFLAQRRYSTGAERYAPLYFAALGAGFILLEIAVIQQTRLFLGHPTLAVTTVLAVLLLAGGLGSGWAGRWPDHVQLKRLPVVAAAIALLALLWLAGWPWLARQFVAGSPALRIGLVAISLTPLALLLGMPFPLGLRRVGQFEAGDRHVALGWAVNGVMTVAGSVLAVTAAMLAGFGSVLLFGAGFYGVAALLAWRVLVGRAPQ